MSGLAAGVPIATLESASVPVQQPQQAQHKVASNPTYPEYVAKFAVSLPYLNGTHSIVYVLPVAETAQGPRGPRFVFR